ncbi:ATP-binding protein [Caenispirillum bisanense]|uniref:sensor histidine kinase n=1 Tax=Caenispirillum bisanense TaxID=414052 RepID=UPI0031D3771E
MVTCCPPSPPTAPLAGGDVRTDLTAAALLDALPNQMCILDASGRVVAVNAAWRSFAAENGHCGGTFVGARYLTICDSTEGAEAGDARVVAAGLRGVLQGRLPVFEHVYPCHAPGRPRWFRMQASRLDDGLVIQHVPATDPARAESDLTQILSYIAHELRTPLGAIAGYSDLLLHAPDSVTPDMRTRFTSTIRDSSLYLSGLIEDMMDLARSQQQNQTLILNEAPCSLADVLAAACDMVTALAAAHGVELRPDALADAAPSAVVLADSRRLTQVAVNLLSNAIKFSPRGAEVRCRLRSTRCDGMVLEVADRGPGIAAEEIPVALSPYGRTASARTTGAPGLGLGLPLSKALVELHGGSLEIASDVGHGTTVTVSLPAWRSQAAAAASAGALAGATAAGA